MSRPILWSCPVHFIRTGAMGAASSRPSLRPLFIWRVKRMAKLGRRCAARTKAHECKDYARMHHIHRRHRPRRRTIQYAAASRSITIASGIRIDRSRRVIAADISGLHATTLRAGRAGADDQQGGPNTSPILTLIRRCGSGALSVTNVAGHAPATRRQRFCRRVFAFSKGLAMLIRSADMEAFAGAAAARTIAAALLPANLPSHGRTVQQSFGLIGLLLLSCP
jgi:hypothetical protein